MYAFSQLGEVSHRTDVSRPGIRYASRVLIPNTGVRVCAGEFPIGSWCTSGPETEMILQMPGANGIWIYPVDPRGIPVRNSSDVDRRVGLRIASDTPVTLNDPSCSCSRVGVKFSVKAGTIVRLAF